MDASELSGSLAHETAVLRRIARRILLEPALAEDAVQEAWLAALRAGKPIDASGAWMTETVRRIARGIRRATGRRDAREQRASRASTEPAAADTAARLELLRELLDALRGLDEPYRTAVQMRVVDDLPPRAIAARTGVPVETARTRVRRGIEQLRKQLDARHASDRGAFLAALAPLAGFGRGATLGSAATLAGGVGMHAMTKAAVVCGVVLIGGVLFVAAWTRDGARGRDVAAPASTEIASSSGMESRAPAQPVADSSPLARAPAETGPHVVIGGIALRGAEPLPGAIVRVQVVEGFEHHGAMLHDALARADARGRFEVACALPAKGTRVHAEGEMSGYRSWGADAFVPRGAAFPNELVVQFHPLDVELRGRVTSSGAAIEGATVSEVGGTTATTNAEGRFTVRGSSVRVEQRMQAWAPGFAERSVTVHVSGPGVCDEIEIQLDRSKLLRGRVVDERGKPVSGAAVTSLIAELASAHTDVAGSFALDGLASVAEWQVVRIEAEGFASVTRSLPEGRVPDDPLEIVLSRGVELRGTVVDAQGTPLPGTHVFSGETPDDLLAEHSFADDDGKFDLHGVPNEELAYGAIAEGYAPFRAVRDPQRDPARLVIVLAQGATVTGRVVDQNGSPVARAGVALRRHGWEYVAGASGRSGSDGSFTLHGVPDEQLTLECWAAGFARRDQPLDPAQSVPIVVELVRTAGLAGRVIEARTRAPVTSFRVRFVPMDGSTKDPRLSGYGSAWTTGVEFRDRNGEWDTRNEQLAAGEATALEITAPGYGTTVVARAVTTVDPTLARIEVALDAGLRVGGRVVDARDGRPIAGARVRRFTTRDEYAVWRDDDGAERAQTVTDEAGEFRFEGLPAEPMSLLVAHPGFATSADGPFAPDRDATPRQISLVPGARVRGVLRDASDAPVVGAKIELSALRVPGAQGRSWMYATDGTGGFAFEELPPGEYQISHRLEHATGAVYDLARQLTLDARSETTIDLQPPGTAEVRGTVIGTDVPAEALVFARRIDGAAESSHEGGRRAAIARGGRFTIAGFAAGRWEISASEVGTYGAPGRRTSKEVGVAAGQTIDIELELGSR